MAEMKTLNGYEIVDAAARERISKLEKAMEEFLGQSGGDSFTPVTLTNGTLTDVQSGATRVKLSGTTFGYMSGGPVNFVFVNSSGEIISIHEMAYGTDSEQYNISVSFDIPSEAVKCGVCAPCEIGNIYAEIETNQYIQCELTLEFMKVGDGTIIDDSIIGTWYIQNFDNLPDGTYTLNFSFNNNDIVQCTAIKKETNTSTTYYTVSYEGYSNSIYDSEIGYISANVGAEITISSIPDNLSANFVNWLKSDCTKR